MNTDTFIKEFGHTKLLQCLTDKEIRWLLSRSFFKSCSEGEQLMLEGEDSTHLLFIVDGGIVTTRTNEEGEEVYIRLLGKGECALDSVIFIEEKSPVGAKSIEKSMVLRVEVEAIRELAKTSLNFSNNLIKILAHFYRDSILQIDNLSIKDSKSRVGYYLLNTYVTGAQESTNITLKFKKNIIASYLGIKPETFSRMLKEMQNADKAISIDGASIKLSNYKSLCDYCDSSTEFLCSHKKDGSC